MNVYVCEYLLNALCCMCGLSAQIELRGAIEKPIHSLFALIYLSNISKIRRILCQGDTEAHIYMFFCHLKHLWSVS